MSDPVVIIGASRTPIESFLGQFRDISAPSLGGRAIAAAVEAAGDCGNEFDECVMGCVLTAGLGQAPARQASLGAGLDDSIGCVTITKMCGSGMKAVMDAHDRIRAGSATAVVASGMESMSNAPYPLERARSGYRPGHGRLCDQMFLDGLEDAYERGRLMGDFADDCAEIF